MFWAEIERFAAGMASSYLIFRDPLFTEERDRAVVKLQKASCAKT